MKGDRNLELGVSSLGLRIEKKVILSVDSEGFF
jgi:hypothetical protein